MKVFVAGASGAIGRPLVRQLVEAGHEAQIFLLGEAVSVMRDPVAAAIVPVGWPPLAEVLRATVGLGIPLHV